MNHPSMIGTDDLGGRVRVLSLSGYSSSEGQRRLVVAYLLCLSSDHFSVLHSNLQMSCALRHAAGLIERWRVAVSSACGGARWGCVTEIVQEPASDSHRQ